MRVCHLAHKHSKEIGEKHALQTAETKKKAGLAGYDDHLLTRKQAQK